MKSELRKIRSFCKTSSQMRAFNELISTFASNELTYIWWKKDKDSEFERDPSPFNSHQEAQEYLDAWREKYNIKRGDYPIAEIRSGVN